MRIIRRYVLREYMVSVFYCMAGLILLHIIIDLFNNLGKMLDARAPWPLVLRYYVSYVTPSLELLLPASLLLATLFTLWQMARHHELVAMQASGISLKSILRIFLNTGIVVSVALALGKETVIPSAGQWAHTYSHNNFRYTQSDVTTPLHYVNSAARRLWDIAEFNPSHPNRLKGVRVTQERPNGSRESIVTTERAEWLDGAWWFYNPQVRSYTADDAPIRPPADRPTIREMRAFSADTPADLAAAAPNRQWEMQSTGQMVRFLRRHKHLSDATLRERWTDVHRNLAAPWACLIVTLFGIPIGARTGRQDVLTGVFLAIGLFFCFYALGQVGIFLAKSQTLPMWAGAWLSNGVFLLVGLVLLWRTQ